MARYSRSSSPDSGIRDPFDVGQGESLNPTEYLLTPDQTRRFVFWVGTDDIRLLNDGFASDYHTYTPSTRAGVVNELVHRHHNDNFLSQYHPNGHIFWFGTYPAAASACSILKANGRANVQMAVVWAEGLALHSVEQMATGLGWRDVRARVAGRLFSEPLSVAELAKTLVQFRWMREILYVPGLHGHVQVPKHVLDQREEDGDADNWGKLQRGLLDEIYLACGRTELAKRDVLLVEMTSGYRFGSMSEA